LGQIAASFTKATTHAGDVTRGLSLTFFSCGGGEIKHVLRWRIVCLFLFRANYSLDRLKTVVAR
jgi:hypothetical protein